MIDWQNILYNGFWIVGISGLLALWSVARWEAISYHVKLSAIFQKPTYQKLLNFSGLIFSIGIILTSVNTIEKALSLLAATYFFASLFKPFLIFQKIIHILRK
jgi:hypothetical protein